MSEFDCPVEEFAQGSQGMISSSWRATIHDSVDDLTDVLLLDVLNGPLSPDGPELAIQQSFGFAPTARVRLGIFFNEPALDFSEEAVVVGVAGELSLRCRIFAFGYEPQGGRRPMSVRQPMTGG